MRSVTAQQLSDGYFIKHGDLVEHRNYKRLRRNPDGTWLVSDPQPKHVYGGGKYEGVCLVCGHDRCVRPEVIP